MEAVRIRTDIERKRLYALGARTSSQSAVGGGLYTAEATERTYARVCALAREVVAAGYVVVDGAFLQRRHRQLFREAAVALQVPFVTLSLSASDSTLQSRIFQRHKHGDDAPEATLAVLHRQQTMAEPLAAEEPRFAIGCDTSTATAGTGAELVERRLDRSGSARSASLTP